MSKDKIIKDLADFVDIQSVSTDPSRFNEILKAAAFLKDKLQSLGFKVREIKKEKTPPLIIAAKIISSQAKTLGIYGHYDVQPEDPLEQWQTDPFKLTIKNGRMYGRGVADNKGHIIQNIASIEELINKKQLKNNVIFIFEGEEETGSIHFEDYLNEIKDLLTKVDVFFITDTGMHERNVPQIFYGLRGLIFFELKVKTGSRDLHSGIYGNRVYNPVQILSDLFTKIKNLKTNKILIPHFYDQVRKLDEKERVLLDKVKVSSEALKKEMGAFEILSFLGCPAYLASKILPSFEINGIISGYIGEGSKTIIPACAMAKFSFRLVEYQRADEIEKSVKEFIKNNLPKGVKYELKTLSKSDPFYSSIRNDYILKTAAILKTVFNNETLFNRSGGTVTAAEVLQRHFKKPIILTGFTLPDDNIHSPNENFDEEMFFSGIEALEKIYKSI